MDRLLFVIRHDRTDLYKALVSAFGGEPHVEVILDRRRMIRRREGSGHRLERRRWDRRIRPAVDVEIRERGWSVVRIPD